MGPLSELVAHRLKQPVVRRLSDGVDWRDRVPAAETPLAVLTGPVLIEEAEPLGYLAQAATAIAAGRDVFLGNPRWTESERTHALALIARGAPGGGRVMIATGGTTGGLRFAMHSGETLLAAARAFQRHFGFGAIHSVCVLPLFHVGGFQQFIRAVATGGSLLLADWKSVEAGAQPALPEGDAVLSLVPAQLQRLIGDDSAVRWLRGFRAIFLGGAPAAPVLLERARQAKLRLAPAYGMTETAAQFAAQRPEEFLAGESGLPLFPGAEARTTKRATDDGPGRIEVNSPACFLGYWPDLRAPGSWRTDDLGEIDAAGRLHVLGRADAAINTGGEKVQPAEVENALRATGAFSEVAVLGVPDARWGEAVAAFFPAADRPDLVAVEAKLRAALSAHKLPRRWVPVPEWPRNDRGKTDRAALRRIGAGNG